jgi:Helix-turn-helix domain
MAAFLLIGKDSCRSTDGGDAMARRARASKAEDAREPLATTAEVAAFLGNTPKHTLENWRSQGKGPPWRKVGRQVLYSWADVDEWLKRQPGGPGRPVPGDHGAAA